MIFIALGIMVLIITVALFVQKVRLKGRMERGLGRKVKNNELTSINAWMDAGSSEGK
jgi:hypothetical protein